LGLKAQLALLAMMARQVQLALGLQVQLALLEHQHLRMFKSSPRQALGRSQQEQGQ
jgi:hypothetical protein